MHILGPRGNDSRTVIDRDSFIMLRKVAVHLADVKAWRLSTTRRVRAREEGGSVTHRCTLLDGLLIGMDCVSTVPCQCAMRPRRIMRSVCDIRKEPRTCDNFLVSLQTVKLRR